MINDKKPCTQEYFAQIVGITQKSVSDLQTRNVISAGETFGTWLKKYCSHLRETAAGRTGVGDLNLADERAAIAKEQRIRVELQNAVTRREYGPIEAMELGVSDAMARAAAMLDTIPGKLKMSSDRLTADDLSLVQKVIADVRNDIAELDIDWFGDSGGENEES